MRRALLTFLFILFFMPYFFALFVARFQLQLPDGFLVLLSRSVAQATVSAGLATFLGIGGALGLLRRSKNWEAVAIAPAVVPAIAIVFGFMTFFPSWRGWFVVAVAHALVSGGLIAVVLSRIVQGSLGSSLELAWVEGASRIDILVRGVLPAIRKDVFRLAISVFAASLTSFSIPMLLGGTQAASLEIAILQSIRLDGKWDVAAALSIFQILFLLSLVLVLGRTNGPIKGRAESYGRTEIGQVIGSDSGVVLLLMAPILVLTALLWSPLSGIEQLVSARLFENTDFLFLAIRGSFVTSTLAGIFAAVILLAFVAAYPSQRLRHWISGYIAPSTAITGFSTLIFGWGSDSSFVIDSFRISIGAALVFVPVLWRLRWEQLLGRLEGQVRVAETLGATHPMIVTHILYPQILDSLFWSAGLVSFWTWGDYAIGSIAASRSMTTALVAKGLLESYRLEAASLLIFATLVLGSVSYRFFLLGGSRVAR